MNKRRKVLSGLMGALLTASLPGMASASGGISFGLNVGPPVYYTPPPVYYSPPPVYYTAPQSYYYQRPPVAYGYPVYPQAGAYNRGYQASLGFGFNHDDDDYSRHEWREHQGWHHHDDD